MWRLLILLSVLELVHCACPDKFELVRNGQCRGQFERLNMQYTNIWSQLPDECNKMQGQPIKILDDLDNEYWSAQAKSIGSSYNVWIGLKCHLVTQQWVWSDGSPVDYMPNFHSADLDKTCTANTCSWYVDMYGQWKSACGTTQQNSAYIFCTVQLPANIPPSDEGCGSFEDDNDDGACYQIGKAAEDWQDAQMTCRTQGADLASIHSEQENSYVRRLAVSRGAVNGVYLGGQFNEKENKFAWIDRSPVDFKKFVDGFPRSGFGECLAMDTTNSAGQWMNNECSAKLPVACSRKQVPIDPNPPCSTAPYKEGELITSPGFPYSASTQCDFFLDVQPGKKVQLQIKLLEANSCCDSLIIYDGYIGGAVLAKLTGEAQDKNYTTTSSNIMRVTWQPKDGVNVRGVALSYRAV